MGFNSYRRIDSCLITVSYDKINWVPIGKTEIETAYPWCTPMNASDSTIIKITAYGKHQERIVGTREDLNFINIISPMIWGLQVH